MFNDYQTNQVNALLALADSPIKIVGGKSGGGEDFLTIHDGEAERELRWDNAKMVWRRVYQGGAKPSKKTAKR